MIIKQFRISTSAENYEAMISQISETVYWKINTPFLKLEKSIFFAKVVIIRAIK